ncbi:MAG TPA: hypothetical protein VEK11_18325 [Thermoanaerobaculia bacterium]|nr:hypothetical protein [Thermoanaerobaculia bacterium]
MTRLQWMYFIGIISAVAIILIGGWIRNHVRVNGKLPAPLLFGLRIALGIIFLILAVIGAFLPILQGWVFLLLALLVLFPKSKFAIKACDKIERKLPRMVAWLRRRGIGVHD